MLLAGLTLLPALMAIFGRAVFWPSKTQAGTGKTGVWGRVSSRIVRHPAPTLVTGLVAFGALAFAVTAYSAAGFGGDTAAPAGSDSAAGARSSPRTSRTRRQPDEHHLPLKQPAWNDLEALQAARSQLEAGGLFAGVAGPLNPTARHHAGPAHRPADRLGSRSCFPTPPPGANIPAIGYRCAARPPCTSARTATRCSS